jgi:pimeloyl-ACP methyl ester carboxylesterase
MRLHYREQGRGPALVILHGLFGSLDNWAFVSQRLAKHFRVFSIDQRNHGESPHAAEMNYSVMADDLREFLEQHELPIAHVLGHSLGGKVAMQFALQYPERVDRLIVADMAPRGYERRHDTIFNALLGLNLESFQTRTSIETALAPQLPDLAVRRFLLKGLTRNEAGKLEWKFNLRTLHESYGALTSAIELNAVFEKSALFIRGGRSDYIREEDSADIHRLFPLAKIVTLPTASHWLHADAPEEFLRITEDYLLSKST